MESARRPADAGDGRATRVCVRFGRHITQLPPPIKCSNRHQCKKCNVQIVYKQCGVPGQIAQPSKSRTENPAPGHHSLTAVCERSSGRTGVVADIKRKKRAIAMQRSKKIADRPPVARADAFGSLCLFPLTECGELAVGFGVSGEPSRRQRREQREEVSATTVSLSA